MAAKLTQKQSEVLGVLAETGEIMTPYDFKWRGLQYTGSACEALWRRR